MNNLIRDTIFNLLDFKYDKEIETFKFEGVYVKFKENRAMIGYGSRAQLARGYFLFAKEILSGKNSFEITQKPKFKHCGAMLDMSRNGVMRVEAVKNYINHMSALGMNMLMLYTEDTYEVKEYPFFGYLRGKYTERELKEIDEYAFNLGIEVIPCIQTLGHLAQYLQWAEAKEIMDTPSVLLVDEEKTYGFLECCIKAVRKIFRTKKIHIGLDEAHDVGLGSFLRKHGYENRFDILNRHILRVVKLCEEHGFEPMMWSDMYFRLGSKKGEYYDPESKISQEVINSIPDVQMIYWDYYHFTEEHYAALMSRHMQLGKEVLFAGVIWTRGRMIPDARKTVAAMTPALKQCFKYKIETVFATMWQDDGCETNHNMALGLLPIFSEHCYLGGECTEKDIYDMCEFLTGIPKEFFDSLKSMHYVESKTRGGCHIPMVKRLFYCDLFYRLMGVDCDFEELEKDLRNTYEIICKYNEDKSDKNHETYSYSKLLCSIAMKKAAIFESLPYRYKNGDKEYLKNLAEKVLPELKEDYKNLLKVHQNQWLGTYKATGWEVLSARYGGILTRLDYIIEMVLKYVNGENETIEELELENLNYYTDQDIYRKLMTPSIIY